MPIEIKTIPMKTWTGKKNKSPKNSTFRANYKNTIDFLRYELEKAGLHGDPQLHMFVNPEDLRLDGNLRANAKPYAPGVKLVFKRKADRFFDEGEQKWKIRLKTVSYPCDAFTDWQDNVRAIALSMEALRKVERYGVFEYGDIMDRLALPSAEGKLSSIEAAAEFIAKHSDSLAAGILQDPLILKKAYRKAAQRLHTDNQITGSRELFAQLVDANILLEKHFENQ